jgi:hypothetical protein
MSFKYIRRAAVALAMLATAGCTIKDTQPPPLTGPSVAGGVVLPPLGQPPTALFTFLPAKPLVNSPVLFDASTSLAGVGASQISDYSWNFGDGTVGSGKNVTHSFSLGISFAVLLTVTNDRGQVASLSKEVPVAPPAAPVAAFEVSPPAPNAKDTVFFISTSITPSGAAIISYSWNFGDGFTCPTDCGSGSSAAPTHSYGAGAAATTRTVNVILTVTDSNGLTSLPVVKLLTITTP